MDRFAGQCPDYAFYRDLWENPQPSPALSSPAKWDEKADEWVKRLKTDGDFQTREMRRVQATADFLRKNGLLGLDSSVLDIGCGPGLFAAEFAKTAGHVTGLDLSSRMLEHAMAYAEKQGAGNTDFIAVNFKELDLDALGWRKKFDLVVSSLTPAVTGVRDLHKLMETSREHCLHVSFVQVEDSLKDKIAADLFADRRGAGDHRDGRVFYSVSNLLFLEGYHPQSFYFWQESHDALVPNPVLARHYAGSLQKDGPEREETAERVHRYLQRVSEGGVLRRHTRECYGYLLWDINKKRRDRTGYGA